MTTQKEVTDILTDKEVEVVMKLGRTIIDALIDGLDNMDQIKPEPKTRKVSPTISLSMWQ